MIHPQKNIWYVCPQIKPKTESRVFLFPYAGGGPTVFNKWNAGFPSTIEVQIVHYPGRGSRHDEAPIRSLFTLVERLAQAILPLLDKPYIFFGHSLGGTVAFELARHLRRNGLQQPTALFISACAAPQTPGPHTPVHRLSDNEFINSLKEIKGMPDEILQNREILDLLLPVLRSDFELIETYRYTPDKSLEYPILAFGGLDDPRVGCEQLEGWAKHTNTRFESRYFAGGHFYINVATEALIESIIREIASVDTLPRYNE